MKEKVQHLIVVIVKAVPSEGSGVKGIYENLCKDQALLFQGPSKHYVYQMTKQDQPLPSGPVFLQIPDPILDFMVELLTQGSYG